MHVTVLISYKMEAFLSFKNNSKNLDPSYGSRSLGLFRKGTICIIAKFYKTDVVICSFS